VNYVLDGETIVFRTDVGRKLVMLRDQMAASFEIDEIDHDLRTGWSVLVQGHAYEASPREVEHLQGRVIAWAGGPRDRWVRLRPTSITGRAIGIGAEQTHG
jgi:nitroimidazol reductase NimA-like FMN-containing flavoprotein (pyridoxamine 5'-phosphate oxidase superfamily)